MGESDLRNVSSVGQARRLIIKDVEDRIIGVDEVSHLLGLFDAFWQYPGEPVADVPHARTKAEKCTNGFINCPEMLKESNLCEILGYQLVMRLREQYSGQVDWCVGAAYAGIDLNHEIARQLNARHAFTEKDETGKPSVWKRHVIPRGEMVLITNELMTTARGSTYETKAGVRDGNAIWPVWFVDFALVLVNRSSDEECLPDGTPVICLARYHMSTYDPGPETCPYCRVGSQSLKPKVGGNWQKYFSGR